MIDNIPAMPVFRVPFVEKRAAFGISSLGTEMRKGIVAKFELNMLPRNTAA
jgi:hypothetical protein